MTQKSIDEMRYRTGFDGWRYYLLLVCAVMATATVGYFTFGHGLTAVLRGDGWMPLLLAACVISLISLWRARPPRL
jgi:K+ transporter